MPLDFHIAKTVDAAVRSPRVLSMPEQMHRSLFRYLQGQADDFPMLGRIADYYKDTKYAADDLSILANEVRRLLANHPIASMTHSILEKFATTADLARSQSIALFAFCD